MLQPRPVHHSLRFYIVLITLVIGGIFIFLLMNSDGTSKLSSAVVGTTENAILEDADTFDPEGFFSTSEEQKELVINEDEEDIFKEALDINQIDFTLNFNQIPSIEKEARIEEMSLRFEDLTTNININNDKLELNNLKDVNLKIKGLVGEINLNEYGASVTGTARRIEVNDIALSSLGEIELSFENLNYKYLKIDEIELQDLELNDGEGELNVGDKLTYNLDNEKIQVHYFNGQIAINREDGTNLDLNGIAKGVSVSGDLLDLKLR